MDRRTKLAVLLIAVILGGHILFTARFQKPRVAGGPGAVPAESLAVAPNATPGTAPGTMPPVASETIAPPPGATPPVATAAEAGPFTPADPEADDIVIKTPLQHIRIARAGGLVREISLPGHKVARTKESVDLLSSPAGRTGRALGIVLRSGDRTYDLSRVQFEPSSSDFAMGDLELAAGSGPRTFEMRATATDGGAFVERFTVDPDRYDLGLELRLETGAGLPRIDSYSVEWTTGMPVTEDNTKEDEQRFRVLAALDNQIVRKRPGDFKRESLLPAAGTLRWACLQDKYFMVGLIPSQPQHGTFDFMGDARTHAVGMRFTQPTPFRSGPDVYRLYAGPLDFDQVKSLGVGLESAVELGYRWIRPISSVLLQFMQFLYRVLPNWGLVIIVVSALAKLVFWPLTDRAMRSMKRMQELQPRMEEIRRRYASDPKAMNEQIMHMYKEQRVNPVGGCMPILVQTPMFFALFAVLQSSIELRNAPFVAWINNLAAPDVLARLPMSLPVIGQNVSLLPLIMGGTMIWQSALGATMAPPAGATPNPLMQQQFVMKWVMPIMMTFFFYKMPSGLVIYWIINTLMSIAQQLQVNRRGKGVQALVASTNPPAAPRAEGRASGGGPNRNDGPERGRGAAERPGRARSQGR